MFAAWQILSPLWEPVKGLVAAYTHVRQQRLHPGNNADEVSPTASGEPSRNSSGADDVDASEAPRRNSHRSIIFEMPCLPPTRREFLALPAELQAEIIALSLMEPGHIEILLMRFPALFATCRALRAHAIENYFGLNKFRITVGQPPRRNSKSHAQLYALMDQAFHRLDCIRAFHYMRTLDIVTLQAGFLVSCELIHCPMDAAPFERFMHPLQTPHIHRELVGYGYQWRQVSLPQVCAAVQLAISAIHLRDPNFGLFSLRNVFVWKIDALFHVTRYFTM